jgi:predicted nucleotidyltransferase
MPHPNLELLKLTAEKLRPLLPEIVFVGGCATGLLVTDPGAAPVRATYDVDIIAEIGSYADYAIFSERLRARLSRRHTRRRAGLPLDLRSLTLDVMPLDEKILGFSNHWYRDAMQSAVAVTISENLKVRAITAPYFLGTKLEAFHGRGHLDYFASHDLEDLIAVVDGRAALLDEVAAAAEDLRMFIGNAIRALLTELRFQDALPGYLLPDAASQSRIPLLLRRLEDLAKL